MTLGDLLVLWFGQALLGWLIADLVSGLLHWWEDRVGDVRLPVLGPLVIAPNRRHHVDQLAFAEAGLVERNLATWLAAALLSVLWLLATGPSITWAAATIGGLVANEVHVLAHRPPAGLLKVLQDVGVIQSPKHHSGHHRPPQDRRYCVLTDWLNPVLDGLGVWAALERGLAGLGLEPNRGAG